MDAKKRLLFDSLILVNANVITLDPLHPKADWVAVANGRIVGLGDRKDQSVFLDKKSRKIDCKDKTVLPGFIDPHLHLVSYAESLVAVNLGPGKDVNSISDLQEKIRTYSKNLPPGKWLRGKGYNEFYLREKHHPDRWDLDKATSQHPIKLTHRSGHAHVLNSLALKLVGISKYTPDPPGGMIERNLEDGEPTGLLYEMGDFLSDKIAPIDTEELEQGLRLANHKLVSLGITTIQDASSQNDSARWKLFKTWKEQGILKPRVNMMLGFPAFKNINKHHFSSGLDESQLRLSTVKIILDETTGKLHPSQLELNEMVMEIHQTGMQVAIHSIEESAIEAACTAIENAINRHPKREHRNRIEHCSVCPPSLAKHIASLGITVVTQPPFIHYNGERYLKTVPEAQLQYLYPLKTLLQHKINVAGSSDCPIVPPNPLIGLYAAVTRMDETGNVVGEDEGICSIDALRIYTQNAARAMFEESIKGTIKPGKLADLVVLNADPTQLTPDEIKDIKVEMTLIDGEVVWKRGT
jgi:predicted amidohydrolase YtcJ